MNPVAAARLAAGALTGIWVLTITLGWLLLPRLLGIDGPLRTIWYAAGWVPAVLIATVPFFVVSTFNGKGY